MGARALAPVGRRDAVDPIHPGATVKAISARGRAKLAADFGPQARRCRSLPCAVCTFHRRAQTTPTDPHHEPPRSRGGTDADALPLCRTCHDLRHARGVVSFWTEAGLEPATILAAVRLGTPTPGDPWDAVPY